MNEKLKQGVVNTLRVNRVSEPGIYLISGDETEVLLPNIYVEKSMQIGSLVDVFIYTDSEDRLVATTLKPYLYLNEFAYLKIVDSAKFGHFVDIGLYKDLQMQFDERTNRLIASEKYFLENEPKNLKQGDEVEIILYSKTPLGFKVIVNNSYEGMIFHSEIFENLKIGDKKKAYIKNLREDGKLDISLQKIGQKVDTEKVLDILKANGGSLNFTYKSEAEDIKNIFAMSKKAFKATLTKLIDEKKINLENDRICLI